MEQPNKPYGLLASEILIPALKVGALSGKPIFCIYWVLRYWLYTLPFFHARFYQLSDDYSPLLFGLLFGSSTFIEEY